MAKKRGKKKRSGHRSRRRIGGVHPAIMDGVMMAGGALVGGVVATYINKMVKGTAPTAPAWIGGAACMAAGVAVPLFAPRTPLMTGVAGGLAAVGGTFVMNETFLSLPGISGIPGSPPHLTRSVGNNAGYLQGNTIAGRGRVGNLSGPRLTLGQIGALVDN